jgi:uncharacterized protein involved in exopolysaccharide biosynthesis
MSIIQFLRILIARRLVILAVLGAALVVAFAVGKLLPARYPATARVLLDSFKPDPVTGTMLQSNALRTFSRTQIELIKDYRVSGDVVDKLGLAQVPSLIAAFQAETGGYGDLRRWIAERITQNVDAYLVENSNILEIRYETVNPELAKRTVNAIREAYVENSLRFRTEGAGRTADWYRDQAERAKRSLEEAQNTKTRFEAENNIIITAGGETETTKLAGLQTALVQARSAQGGQDFAATSRAIASPVVDQLKVQLATMNDQIGQAAEKLGMQHPTYQALLARRATLENQLRREETAARAAGAMQRGSTRQSLADLEAAYQAQRAKVAAMQDKLDRDAQLQREVEIRREQYEAAAKRTAELRLESAVNDSGLIVLGDAATSMAPSFPNWTQISLLAVGLGTALGVIIALFIELLNRRVRGAEDLVTAANVQVLAVVGQRPRPEWRRILRRILSRASSSNSGLQPAE